MAAASAENGEPQRNWVPRPDPTLLTTEQSNRLRAEMQREVQGLREVLETRLGAMDLATELLRTSLTKVASSDDLNRRLSDQKEFFVEKLIGTRQEFLEKFASIAIQFNERDVRTKSASEADNLKIKDALQAQKESAAQTQQSNADAILKSEAATTKQLDGIQLTVKTLENNLNDRISEIRRAIDRGEGTSKGASETRSDTRQNVGMIVGLIGGVFGFIGMVGMIITIVISLSHATAPVAPGAPLTVAVPAQK